MSVHITETTDSVMLASWPAKDDMPVYTTAAVDAHVAITLHMRTPDDDAISIKFGNERVTLEFYDVESLERVRDVADDAAQRLRAAVETAKRTDATEDSPILTSDSDDSDVALGNAVTPLPT